MRFVLILLASVALAQTPKPGVIVGGGGGGASGASSLSALTDFNLTRTSNTVLTVNSAASSSAPVVMSCGNNSTQITAPGTITLTSGTANVSGFLYLDCATGSPVLTFGHNSANAYTGSGVTVATGITGFPAGSVNRPLWLATGTAGVWDAVAPANDRRSAFNTMKQLTAGANVTLTETAGQVQIASTGGAAFNPLDFTTMYERIYFQRLAYTSILGSGWSYLGACGGGTSTAPTAGDAAGVGFVNADCWILHPNSASTQASLPLFLHGATPRPYNVTLRAGKGSTTGDIYYGFSSSATSGATGNFVGVRWSNAGSVWQCVIRSAGVDVAATTITGSVNDSNLHTFTISNDATANRVQCSFDGGALTTASGTIPTYSAVYVMLGTPAGSTNFFLRSMGYAIQGQNQ